MLVRVKGGTYRSVQAYSKMGPLVITKAIEEDGYTITHRESGYRIMDPVPRLRQAFAILARVRDLADWSQDSDALAAMPELGEKVRAERRRSLPVSMLLLGRW